MPLPCNRQTTVYPAERLTLSLRAHKPLAEGTIVLDVESFLSLISDSQKSLRIPVQLAALIHLQLHTKESVSFPIGSGL